MHLHHCGVSSERTNEVERYIAIAVVEHARQHCTIMTPDVILTYSRNLELLSPLYLSLLDDRWKDNKRLISRPRPVRIASTIVINNLLSKFFIKVKVKHFVVQVTVYIASR